MPLTLPKNYCWPSFVTRFVATSGFTPDVKVWEVKFSRSGDFEKAARAFDLTGAVSIDLLSMFKNCCSGHRSGVYSFAFSADSGKMATVKHIPFLVVLWTFVLRWARMAAGRCLTPPYSSAEAKMRRWILEMLDIAISFKGAGNWLLSLGQQPAQSDITFSWWPCCSHCTGDFTRIALKGLQSKFNQNVWIQLLNVLIFIYDIYTFHRI